MKFSGRLQIEADPRNWLKTDLNLNNGRLELVSGGDILGSWSTAQVKAERVEGDRFQLHLGDDRAVFAADDALAFSYEALPALAKKTVLASATGLRGKLRKGLGSADRTAQTDTQDPVEPVAAAVADFEPEEDVVDVNDVPQPPRKLRDLIQAAVRSNLGETPAPADANWWGPESAYRDSTPEEPIVDHEVHAKPEPAEAVWAEPEEIVPDPEPEVEVREAEVPEAEFPEADLREAEVPEADAREAEVPETDAREAEFPEADAREVEAPETDLREAEVPLAEVLVETSFEEPSLPDLPEIGNDTPQERATFDLSPIFAEPAALYETIESARPPRSLLDLEGTGFENGDTLGERPAEPFGWIRAAEEALPAVVVEPPTQVVRSLDILIQEVRSGGMSPAQVGAVSDLIKAVAEAIEAKNRR